jgi:hypothetical protein
VEGHRPSLHHALPQVVPCGPWRALAVGSGERAVVVGEGVAASAPPVVATVVVVVVGTAAVVDAWCARGQR